MKFSDHFIRNYLDTVFVKRNEKEMSEREEFNSLQWRVKMPGIGFDHATRTKVHLYSVPAREVKIGENIYDDKGKYIAYRSN